MTRLTPTPSPLRLQIFAFIGLAASTTLSATEPASNFNLNGQARTRSCTPMHGKEVPLRFADGTPTGFYVRADDPSKQGGKKPCPADSMEIDAHEVLRTSTGMELFFHPGGGGSHYEDPVENGQYGHIALADLEARPVVQPTPNEKAAPLARTNSARDAYFVTPTRIPDGMFYKPNAHNGHSGSTYLTYGNPGYDKTAGRGDWTYINWSWVQNGGATYPANICRGGGMVRALGKRNEVFNACVVEPIIGWSYGANNEPNGRVTAFYGKTASGKGASDIYGWMPHSYQKNGDIIIPCVRRCDVGESAPALAPDASGHNQKDRSERMAMNLFARLEVAKAGAHRLRSSWSEGFPTEPDAQARMELVSETCSLDDRATVAQLVQWLHSEKDSRVREQIIVILGYLGATPREMKEVTKILRINYHRYPEERERSRTLEIVSNLPMTESGEMLTALWREVPHDAEDKIAIAEAILKFSRGNRVDQKVIDEIQDFLRKQASASVEEKTRWHALHLLAIAGLEDHAFLIEMLRSEKAPKVKAFLEKATRQHLPEHSPG